MATARVLQLLRRRPLTSSVLVGGTSLLGYATVVEYNAEWLEQQYLKDPSNNANDHGITLPRSYDWNIINAYWSSRPITSLMRFVHITYELSPVVGRYIKDFVIFNPPTTAATTNVDVNVVDEDDYLSKLQIYHASKLCDSLMNLGPAFIKFGQQLSIRPDLIPHVVLKELQKLCDSVKPIPNEIAYDLIRNELQTDNLDTIFEDMTLVAAASLGQVYKAKLKNSDEYVAIKVQRPDMEKSFSLDLYLLRKMSILIDGFTSIFTNQPPFHQELYESFSKGSYMELDYENEASNQKRFQKELAERNSPVIIPNVYDELSTRRILTTQWIDGIKLANSSQEKIRELIPVGVELFLTQLLDIGAFHADPHPGNLLVTTDGGKLCLLDFGLCAEVDQTSRNAMTKAIVHLLLRDFDTLVSQDAKELGFLPHDYDTSELKPILIKILTVGLLTESSSNLHRRKRKLMEISNELNEVFFRYPFSVPPFFALITRGLGLLEGIALTGDPDFDIFHASVPYAKRRAVGLLGSHSLSKLRRMTGEASKY